MFRKFRKCFRERLSLNYGFHCADLCESAKCSTALNEECLLKIAQKPFGKYEKYG
jgi:hypothetical protein